ncbi:MAG: RagB/SusD family nutrient uptake outer membrane protein [Flavobacteriales bacterium]|nr:RagB/SusD family nutrient uptake outer membrane protein [Flavobacteriales bacterium]
MKRILSIFVALIVLASCKKVLNIEPVDYAENDVVISSPADLYYIVESIYDGMQSGNVLGGNRIIFADLLADDATVIESNLSAFGTLEMYNRTMSSQIGDLRSMWRDGYSTINRANNVIKAVDDGVLDSHEDYVKEDFDLYKATALFARASVHFEMVRFWAQPYDPESSNNTQSGIPYRLEPTLAGPDNLEMARNTVEEVYDNAVTDLLEAIALLEPLGNGSDIYDSWDKYRIDQWAIKAYLTRIYFYGGDYTAAADIGNEVINSGIFQLTDEPRTNFTQAGAESTSDQIFQLISISEDQSGNPSWGYSRFGSPLFMPNSAMQLYHENDIRLDNTKGFLYTSFFGDSTIAKYDLPNANSGINMCVLRLAEVYLNVAEANLSQGGNGNSQKAFDLYSELYEIRADSVLTMPPTDDSLLTLIQLERRLELMYEGDRYHNLKRMKMKVRGGVSYSNPSLLFKIPQEEMSGNSLMEQNP